MSKLATIQIPTDPATIKAMMAAGRFHSWQDGRWRYSPYGGETVYCNDPTEQFSPRVEFGKGRAAAICKPQGIYAVYYGDGTRGLCEWDADLHTKLRLLYGFSHVSEREQYDYLEKEFKT